MPYPATTVIGPSPAFCKRLDLTLEQRAIADPGEALGPVADDAFQAAAAAGGENDGSHSGSSAGCNRFTRSIWPSLTR